MAAGYARKENAVYDIYGRFADRDIGECPFCKNPEPKFRVFISSGRYRTRTCDLLHVKQMLYQLS